jgi:predicted Zn-dependent protease
MDRVAFFRDYLQTKPDDRFARYSLALELKKAGQLDEAEAELRTMLAAHPQSGRATCSWARSSRRKNGSTTPSEPMPTGSRRWRFRQTQRRERPSQSFSRPSMPLKTASSTGDYSLMSTMVGFPSRRRR